MFKRICNTLSYLSFALASLSLPALAQKKPAPPPTNDFSSSPTVGGMSAPIEVRGQSRNLNMTLLLNNRTQAIQFVEPRKDYKKEIPETVY